MLLYNYIIYNYISFILNLINLNKSKLNKKIEKFLHNFLCNYITLKYIKIYKKYK